MITYVIPAAIGAGATLSQLIQVLEGLPAADAAPTLTEPLLAHLRRIAGTLVRNVGSLGGNLHMARFKVSGRGMGAGNPVAPIIGSSGLSVD